MRQRPRLSPGEECRTTQRRVGTGAIGVPLPVCLGDPQRLTRSDLTSGGTLEVRDLAAVSSQPGDGGSQARDGSCRTSDSLTTTALSHPDCHLPGSGVLWPVPPECRCLSATPDLVRNEGAVGSDPITSTTERLVARATGCSPSRDSRVRCSRRTQKYARGAPLLVRCRQGRTRGAPSTHRWVLPHPPTAARRRVHLPSHPCGPDPPFARRIGTPRRSADARASSRDLSPRE